MFHCMSPLRRRIKETPCRIQIQWRCMLCFCLSASFFAKHKEFQPYCIHTFSKVQSQFPFHLIQRQLFVYLLNGEGNTLCRLFDEKSYFQYSWGHIDNCAYRSRIKVFFVFSKQYFEIFPDSEIDQPFFCAFNIRTNFLFSMYSLISESSQYDFSLSFKKLLFFSFLFTS